MIDDEIPLSLRSGSVLLSLTKEDLDPLSVDDLKDRLDALNGEIKRTQTALEAKKNRLSAAEALFSFKGR